MRGQKQYVWMDVIGNMEYGRESITNHLILTNLQSGGIKNERSLLCFLRLRLLLSYIIIIIQEYD